MKKEINELEFKKLDPATVILLNNSGLIELSDAERAKEFGKYKSIVSKISESVDCKPVKKIPDGWPKDIILPDLPLGPNDYSWYEEYSKILPKKKINEKKFDGLSVVVPTFNRSRILSITLACLARQITKYKFEVIVADDGSREDLTIIIKKYEKFMDLKYVRQKDYGYQLCAVRNLGMRVAKYRNIAILDCDMAPTPAWVESYSAELEKNDYIALIGTRRYVDTTDINDDDILADKVDLTKLPDVITNNVVAGKSEGHYSVDWRLEHFEETDNLRTCNTPFRYFSGGNVAFSKRWLEEVGEFDEEFTHWGGEDNEFGYRLFRGGCYFKALNTAVALHQEPPGKENETDRAAGKEITLTIVKDKVPYFYRKLEELVNCSIKRKPLVSIYIPAYNCAGSIARCVFSALNQTVVDLEVCVCDDGSTDDTLKVLYDNFGSNPRVKFFKTVNGGIASASNLAVEACNGFYVGQLDSDDYLEPDAVEVCLKEFLRDRDLVCVYTTNRNVTPDGRLISYGYNWPEFSREKFMTAMICHHFRMFTYRSWVIVGGFNVDLFNAVDYDFYLKLSEIGKFKHVNKVCYNRVLHGDNTSIRHIDKQKVNHFSIVNDSLRRQRIGNYVYKQIDDNPSSRAFSFVSV